MAVGGGAMGAGGASGAGGTPEMGGTSETGGAQPGGMVGMGGAEAGGTPAGGGMSVPGGMMGAGGMPPAAGQPAGGGAAVADPCEDVACGANADCEDGTCVCRDGYEGPDCSIPPLPMGDTVAMCQSFIECDRNCESDRCREMCLENEANGAAVYIRLIACVEGNQCWQGDTIDPECANRLCQPEVSACFGDGAQPDGDLTCMESLTCRVECGNDGRCLRDCVTASNPMSHALLEEALVCADDNDCFTAEGLDLECAYDWCDGEWRACREDSQGELFCGQMMSCVQECEDSECVSDCYYQGRVLSQELFSRWADCVAAEECADPFDCAACGPLENACWNEGI